MQKSIASRLAKGDANSVPILLPIAQQILFGNRSHTGSLIGFDLDGDALKYSVRPYPRGFYLDATSGTYRWAPYQAKSGTYRLEFSASDGKKAATQTGVFIIRTL